MLWACDALIIRGEDSFVRAQLAGKPFLWTIYPQEEDTHIVKLNAFLDRMAVEYGEDAARVWRETSLGWNQASLTPGLWSRFRDLTPELTRGSLLWSYSFSRDYDWAGQLSGGAGGDVAAHAKQSLALAL